MKWSSETSVFISTCNSSRFSLNFEARMVRRSVDLKLLFRLGRGEHSYFNNEYYKSLTKQTDYLIGAPFDEFALIGGTDGEEARVTWKVGGRGWNTDGGPYLWTKNQAY